jgi:hypothetical protein
LTARLAAEGATQMVWSGFGMPDELTVGGVSRDTFSAERIAESLIDA